MFDVLSDEFFLIRGQIEISHPLLKNFPGIASLRLLISTAVVLALDVVLCDFGLFFHVLGDLGFLALGRRLHLIRGSYLLVGHSAMSVVHHIVCLHLLVVVCHIVKIQITN